MKAQRVPIRLNIARRLYNEREEAFRLVLRALPEKPGEETGAATGVAITVADDASYQQLMEAAAALREPSP